MDSTGIGVEQTAGGRRIAWEGGAGPSLPGPDVWLRGVYEGDRARLLFSLDGRDFRDAGLAVTLRFAKWKGARPAVFCYGPNGGAVDVDYVRYDLGDQKSP